MEARLVTNKNSLQLGFTVIELIIVVSIIGILITIFSLAACQDSDKLQETTDNLNNNPASSISVNGYICYLSSPVPNAVALTIKNISHKKQPIKKTMIVEKPLYAFASREVVMLSHATMHLIDARGNEIPPTWEIAHLEPAVRFLQPGQEVTYVFDIRKAFEIKKEGHYMLTVKVSPAWDSTSLISQLELPASPEGASIEHKQISPPANILDAIPN